MNSEATPSTATLTKTPNTGLYSSSRQVYARRECKLGRARLTSDPQPSRAKLAPIRAATDIVNPTIEHTSHSLKPADNSWIESENA